jgi:hypothetical protein
MGTEACKTKVKGNKRSIHPAPYTEQVIAQRQPLYCIGRTQFAEYSKSLSNVDLFIYKSVCKQLFAEVENFEYTQFVPGHQSETLQLNLCFRQGFLPSSGRLRTRELLLIRQQV